MTESSVGSHMIEELNHQLLAWHQAMVLDLDHRAHALAHLVASVHSVQPDTEPDVTDSAVLVIRVDRDAWAFAVAANAAPRPPLPAIPQS